MSLDVAKKVAQDHKLSEREVKYAVDHAINLPAEYGERVASIRSEMSFGTPVGGGVVQTGPAFESAASVTQSGPGVFLDTDALSELKKDTLSEIADVVGIEAQGTKAQMVATLVGAEAGVEDDEGDDDEDAE